MLSNKFASERYTANTLKSFKIKQLILDFMYEKTYHTCIFQGEINGPAGCANTQLSLFNRSVIAHAAADLPVLCANPLAESKRRMMPLERKKEQQTYPQRWHEYNLSQTREKSYFLELLHRLCALIEEPEKPKGKGRPSVPVSDVVFSACVKVYGCMSGRRNQTDLDEAFRRGHLSRPVRYNTLFKYLELETLTPILRQLITESALPLKAVETDFAVDSSGFSTNRFVRWYGMKYGGTEDWHDWVKLHAMAGVTTHIITSVEISGRHAHDSKFFEPLVNATARNFTLGEISADKAYGHRAHLRLVEGHGGTPYIAFRSNARGDGKCETWNRIFHYYSMNREEYMRHYHRRSNIESTFSMIKSRFGERVRGKTPAAQVNEVLVKVLCHNLCVLVQSIYELGLDVEFIGKNSVCLQNEAE